MTKILTTIISAIALCSITACDQSPKFSIEGNIENANDSVLYLEAITLDGVQKLDSVKLNSNGDFKFKAPAPAYPEFYSLRINQKRINLAIDSTETIIVKASLPQMSTNYTVEGSKSCENIRQIVIKQIDLQNKINAIGRNTNLYPKEITDSIDTLIQNYKKIMRDEYILKNASSTEAYYAVCQSIIYGNSVIQVFNPIDDRNDVKCYAAVANSWDALYHDSERTIQLCNLAIKGMNNTAPSQQKIIEIDESKISEAGIIPIKLPDINSKLIDITSLKGKVVLLDFTKYGIKDSAERTRKMRDLYDKYKNRGFEIYQVSLDDDIHYWKISCENLPWICVHETNGSTTGSYGVNTLPTSFIINRNNEVVIRSEMIKTSIEEEIEKLL